MRELIIKEYIDSLGGISRQQAHELYCSLCSRVWIHHSYDAQEFIQWFRLLWMQREDKFPHHLSYSWRAAGGLISRVAENNDDYLSFYCGGEGDVYEGMVTVFAQEFWTALGFKLCEDAYAE